MFVEIHTLCAPPLHRRRHALITKRPHFMNVCGGFFTYLHCREGLLPTYPRGIVFGASRRPSYLHLPLNPRRQGHAGEKEKLPEKDRRREKKKRRKAKKEEKMKKKRRKRKN